MNKMYQTGNSVYQNLFLEDLEELGLATLTMVTHAREALHK